MIRIGKYTANDKWDIVCRYWSDPESVADPRSGRRGNPSLLEWHAMAYTGGQQAVTSHMGALARPQPTEPDDPGDREILRLFGEYGVDETTALASELAEALRHQGYREGIGTPLPPAAANRLRQIFKQGALKYLDWTLDAAEIPSIEDIRLKANPFPAEVIAGKNNVLCLFCALFYGRADVIHVYDAAPAHATLVDNMEEHLTNMKLIYPPHWRFVSSDYRTFLAEAVKRRENYDLIIADHSRELARTVLWDYLPTLMSLCSDAVIGNYLRDMAEELGVEPDDLVGLSRAVKEKTGVDVTFSQMPPRFPNSDVYWAVMHKN